MKAYKPRTEVGEKESENRQTGETEVKTEFLYSDTFWAQSKDREKAEFKSGPGNFRLMVL